MSESETKFLLKEPSVKNTNMCKIKKLLKKVESDDKIYLYIIISKENKGCFPFCKRYKIIDCNLFEIDKKSHSITYVNEEGYFYINLNIVDDSKVLFSIKELPSDYKYTYGSESYDMTDDTLFNKFNVEDIKLLESHNIINQLINVNKKVENDFITLMDVVNGYEIKFKLV
jgi:hypothetical protein